MRHEDRPLVCPLLKVTIVDMWSGGNQSWVPGSTQTKQRELDGVQTATYETRVGPPRGICWSPTCETWLEQHLQVSEALGDNSDDPG